MFISQPRIQLGRIRHPIPGPIWKFANMFSWSILLFLCLNKACHWRLTPSSAVQSFSFFSFFYCNFFYYYYFGFFFYEFSVRGLGEANPNSNGLTRCNSKWPLQVFHFSDPAFFQKQPSLIHYQRVIWTIKSLNLNNHSWRIIFMDMDPIPPASQSN